MTRARSFIVLLVWLSSAAAARADDCPPLFAELARTRAAVEQAIADPSKSKAEVNDFLSQNTAAANKLSAHCREKFDDREQLAWTKSIDDRRDGYVICGNLRKGQGSDEEATLTTSDDLIADAVGCITDLAAYRSAKMPALSECLGFCEQYFATHVKRTPQCLERVASAKKVLADLTTFMDKAKGGKLEDVMIDANVFADRLRNVILRRDCIDPDTVPEIAVPWARLFEEARALSMVDGARKAYDKAAAAHNLNAAHADAVACNEEMVRIPNRDARLEKLHAECRALADKTQLAPTVGVKTERIQPGRPRKK